MHRHLRTVLMLLVAVFATGLNAQLLNTDSLRAVLRSSASDDSSYLRTCGSIAQQYWWEAEMDSVIAWSDVGIARFAQHPPRSKAMQHQLLRLHKLKAMGLFGMGRWPEAMIGFQRMNELAVKIKDPLEIGRSFTYEGHTFREMGDNVNSAARYREAFAQLEPLEHGTDLGNAYHGYASTLTNMRQWDSSVVWFDKAMAIYRATGDVPHAVGTRFNLAENYYAAGQHELERVQFDSIAAHPELIDGPDQTMRFLFLHARTHMPMEGSRGFIPALDSALRIATEIKDTNSMSTIVLLRALAHAHANEWPAAYHDLEDGKNDIWADMGIAKVRATEAARQQFEREKEQALANAQLKKERLQKIAASVIGALAVLLAVVLYRSFHAQSRAAEALRLKNEEIERAQSRLIASEKRREAEQVRTRIARDIHDDIGATLTKIALLSGVATQKSQDPAELGKTFARISEHTRNVSRALSDVVWAVDPQRDTHQGMIDHVRDLSQRLLGDNGIRYELDLFAEAPESVIAPALKRDLHLVLNECFNNILKYSHAQLVKVKFDLHRNAFELRVEDDGVGFDPALVPDRGNGLKNMPARIAQHGGTLAITSAPGKGTTLHARGPLI